MDEITFNQLADCEDAQLIADDFLRRKAMTYRVCSYACGCMTVDYGTGPRYTALCDPETRSSRHQQTPLTIEPIIYS